MQILCFWSIGKILVFKIGKIIWSNYCLIDIQYWNLLEMRWIHEIQRNYDMYMNLMPLIYVLRKTLLIHDVTFILCNRLDLQFLWKSPKIEFLPDPFIPTLDIFAPMSLIVVINVCSLSRKLLNDQAIIYKCQTRLFHRRASSDSFRITCRMYTYLNQR